MYKLILASASARRSQILSEYGIAFEIIKSDCEEHTDFTAPDEVVRDLSLQKARDVQKKAAEKYPDEDILVLSADTIVSYKGEILGKPADKDEARKMLHMLCGKTHEVITGVCVKSPSFEQVFTEVTKVKFGVLDSFQEELIERYINTDEPYDKAGAYGIQNGGALLVDTVEGDYFNVVGLPVRRLSMVLGHLHIGY